MHCAQVWRKWILFPGEAQETLFSLATSPWKRSTQINAADEHLTRRHSIIFSKF